MVHLRNFVTEYFDFAGRGFKRIRFGILNLIFKCDPGRFEFYAMNAYLLKFFAVGKIRGGIQNAFNHCGLDLSL